MIDVNPLFIMMLFMSKGDKVMPMTPKEMGKLLKKN